jgi:LytS/YehU family sensor histidine kinase
VNSYFQTVNAFLEDTCVIIVLAYLLARGRMLALLLQETSSRRRTLYLGAIFGVIGITEVIFPGARYPYVTNTLIITFAAFTVGLPPALFATCLIGVFSLMFQSPANVARTSGTDCLAAIIGGGIAHILSPRWSTRNALFAGICAQSAAMGLLIMVSRMFHTPFSPGHALMSVPANGLGMALLLLVVNDARVRSESERHKNEAERSNALVAESQIRALRARIHPHFLFNTLTSIAALCSIAPDKAERAVVCLSQMMRRSLEANPAEPLCLSAEMEYVKGYLEIEQHRFGTRLHVRTKIDPASLSVVVPAFAIQTLVENAVNHGIAPEPGPGTLCIVARTSPRYLLLAVVDDGAGISKEARKQAVKPDTREHGIQILTAQLLLLYGRRARVRLLRREEGGTLAAFFVPLSSNAVATKDKA